MSQPILIWNERDEAAKTTTLRVDVNYLQSLERHLQMNGVNFTVYERVHKDIGSDRDGEGWSITTNEIVIHHLVNPETFLQDWNIQKSN